MRTTRFCGFGGEMGRVSEGGIRYPPDIPPPGYTLASPGYTLPPGYPSPSLKYPTPRKGHGTRDTLPLCGQTVKTKPSLAGGKYNDTHFLP